MLSGTSGELSPTVTGFVYCIGIAACTQVYAFDRAREWTSALTEWCDSQPQLRTFAGACLVHRAELMQLGGAWGDAIELFRVASERVLTAHDPITSGDAAYQRGEIHRLRGEHEQAEAAYAEAAKNAREALPGLALLRLAQGKAEVAASATRRVLGATSDRLQRVRYLPAHVEIMLAIGALDEAKTASAELDELSSIYGGEVLQAMAQQARALIAPAEGQPQAARRAHQRARREGRREDGSDRGAERACVGAANDVRDACNLNSKCLIFKHSASCSASFSGTAASVAEAVTGSRSVEPRH
jgi:tetratricopeptide (TPR) repeat protein